MKKKRIPKKYCHVCHHNITPRYIQFYSGLIRALYEVCKFAQKKGVKEFRMVDIRDVLKKNEYARFGDLVYFAGIIKKKGKAHYEIDLSLAKLYFKGEMKAPLYILKDPVTNKIIERKDGYITELKELKEFLHTENKLYLSHINKYKVEQGNEK